VTVNGDVNLSLKTPGALSALSLTGGSAGAPRLLSGSFDVNVLPSLGDLYTDLQGLTVRATQSLGTVYARNMTNTVLSAAVMGNVQVVSDLTGSMLLSGRDIGADLLVGTGDDGAFTAGTGNIGAVNVGNDMSGSTIAANVSPGADGLFGTGDDVILSSSLQGAIASLTVVSTLTGSADPSEYFGVVAHQTLGPVTAGGIPLSSGWSLGNIALAGNIT
jgi:hypothetical protein